MKVSGARQATVDDADEATHHWFEVSRLSTEQSAGDSSAEVIMYSFAKPRENRTADKSSSSRNVESLSKIFSRITTAAVAGFVRRPEALTMINLKWIFAAGSF